MVPEIYSFSRPRSLRLKLSIFLLLTVLVSGTAGYRWIEGWPLLESFYMTVITVSTVGFQEVAPLSREGLLFTVLLIGFGVTAVALSITSLFEYFVLRGLTGLFGRNTMDKQIGKLSGHTIVCGYGRTGFYIVRDLREMKKPLVVIESDPERVALLQEEGIYHVQGDAGDEGVLEEAGLGRAASLVATLANDADNLFVTLSARSINNGLQIIARVEDPANGRKFMKAGATQVVSPFSAGANRMVQLLTRPAVVDLIELVTGRENLALEVCEIKVDSRSDLAHKSLAEARVRQTLGCMVVAVKRPAGEALFDPDPQFRLQPGDVLVAIRKPQNQGSGAATKA
jgi:voltage-gated potassium channel